MNGLVHSINISSGGVPKSSVGSAKVSKNGVEGDFNVFRESRGGDSSRAVCIFSLERIEEFFPLESPSGGPPWRFVSRQRNWERGGRICNSRFGGGLDWADGFRSGNVMRWIRMGRDRTGMGSVEGSVRWLPECQKADRRGDRFPSLPSPVCYSLNSHLEILEAQSERAGRNTLREIRGNG